MIDRDSFPDIEQRGHIKKGVRDSERALGERELTLLLLPLEE